uniref:Uncharacterized protein n=1 Tax=Acrobeloides nanus TaxID=290746 RepID=A0A914DYW1_9BILA
MTRGFQKQLRFTKFLIQIGYTVDNRVATSYRVPTSNGTSYRTSVKYTRTTDEMATSYSQENHKMRL